MHFFRLSVLTKEEMDVVLRFYAELESLVRAALRRDDSFTQRPVKYVLAMDDDGSVHWRDDWRWTALSKQFGVLRPRDRDLLDLNI